SAIERKQETIENLCAGAILQKGANVGEISDRSHPQGVARDVFKVFLREMLELLPRFFGQSNLAVDQSQTRAPGGVRCVSLHEVSDQRFEFFEAALLTPNREHLQCKNAGGVFGLQALANV